MAARTCIVRFVGKDGIAHEVGVRADSVYEAVARALRAFRDQDCSVEDAHWTGYLEVVPKQPEVKHRVLLNDFETWLERSGGSPKEMTKRQRIRAILDGR